MLIRITRKVRNDGLRAVNENCMNTEYNELEDELRSEYDETVLHDGVRGKYVQRYQAGVNVVVLDPDVAQAFPTTQAVNEALRLLLNIAQNTVAHPTEVAT